MRDQFQDIYREIEKRASRKWVAVYVFGLLSGREVRVGVTQNPDDVRKTGQQWHSQETCLHALLWCEGRDEANRVLEALKRDLIPNHLRGTWYNLAPDAALMAADFAAREVGVEVYTEQQRLQAIDQTAYQVIRKAHPQLLTNVVPISRRVN